EDRERRADLVTRKIEGRPNEDIPETIDGRLRLPEPSKQVGELLAVVGVGIEPGEASSDPCNGKAVREAQVAVAEERERTRPDHSDRPIFCDHRQLQPLSADRRPLPDVVKELQVGVKTAE